MNADDELRPTYTSTLRSVERRLRVAIKTAERLDEIADFLPDDAQHRLCSLLRDFEVAFGRAYLDVLVAAERAARAESRHLDELHADAQP